MLIEPQPSFCELRHIFSQVFVNYVTSLQLFPQLDVDLTAEILEHPERFPLKLKYRIISKQVGDRR